MTAALNPYSHALRDKCGDKGDTAAARAARSSARREALEAFQANLAEQVTSPT